VQKTVFVYNEKDDKQAAIVDDAMEKFKEASSLLKTHFFCTEIEVPEDFIPSVVGGLTDKFKLTTIAKLVKDVKAKKRSIMKRRVSPDAK
jgi:hypothetical protein